MELNEYLSFVALWLGFMALICGALFLCGLFRKKDKETPVNPEEYAKEFEEKLNEMTEEKPIKAHFRNPFFLSADEIRETKEAVEKSEE